MRAALAGSTGAEKGAQPQLHLALLKYAFEGALPCAPAQRRHLQRAAGMAVALTQDEETQIVSLPAAGLLCFYLFGTTLDCALAWRWQRTPHVPAPCRLCAAFTFAVCCWARTQSVILLIIYPLLATCI